MTKRCDYGRPFSTPCGQDAIHEVNKSIDGKSAWLCPEHCFCDRCSIKRSVKK